MKCTHCGELISQDQNLDGRIYCIHCGSFFMSQLESVVPTWVWGIVVVLMAQWQILRTI
jgi:hypothetical protein